MIDFTAESVDFPNINFPIIKKWISEVLNSFDKTDGDINFIFCNDDYILQVNQEYLNHDYYTDIITFDFCVDTIVSGDLIISVDTVLSNSIKFNTNFTVELHRVIIHGILHLLGFKDKSEVEQQEMTLRENGCLALLETLS